PVDWSGHIRMNGVSFRYHDHEEPAVKALSLDIVVGTTVGIVGGSGSGKSTLLGLLQGLYKPTEGQITIDGLPYSRLDPGQVGRNIGVALQDSTLFRGTIYENLTARDLGASRNTVMEAATIAGVEEFVRRLPDGYDTMVGDGARILSGGQRQRIAIARALLGRPKVLILDEALSGLEYEVEQAIHRKILQYMNGSTV